MLVDDHAHSKDTSILVLAWTKGVDGDVIRYGRKGAILEISATGVRNTNLDPYLTSSIFVKAGWSLV